MDINIERIEKAVAAEMAQLAMDQINPVAMIEKAAKARIDQAFAEQAGAAITAAVNDAIREGFDHAYCAVDHFGKAKGKPTTIREELGKLIAGYWNQMVDRNGKPAEGYGEKSTRAEWLRE